jgi:hypothetical protein
MVRLDVDPEQKASSLLHCLAYTLRDDLVVYRKEAVAKAFLESKTAWSSTGDADTEVEPAQPEEASASEASKLFFAWWPSSSFPSPGWPDVVQNFKCAHRILTTNGFLIVADPENLTGDGKSWVLECKPTAKLPKDADPADLARQCLESEGVKADEVVQLDEADRTLHVSLSPPPQPITSVEVQEEPRTERRTKLLQKIYGFVPAKTSENAKPLSKFEATVGKLMSRARRSCPTKYLPLAEILKIAALLDDENLPVRGNLEREAARTMAEYNQRHPTGAIKSWRAATRHPMFRRAVRKRFSRAEEKYRKATLSILAPSAGTPRTTI